MAVIKVVDNQIEISEIQNNPDVKLTYENIGVAMCALQNMKAKFERFVKGEPGFEKRQWIGWYHTFPNKYGDIASNIINHHLVNAEKDFDEQIPDWLRGNE